MKIYIVYSINYLNQPIYIGITNNLKRRTTQHNYLFKKGKSKQVYDYLRSLNQTNITLNTIKEFKTRTEAKRYEMYLILIDYFGNKHLKQSVPNISDR